MKKKRIPVDKTSYVRTILTDTLPYEIPLFFTNEALYELVRASPTLEGYPDLLRILLKQSGPTRPFTYSVQKGGGSFRELAVPHPASQLQIAELYRDYDAFIENVCARSKFSIRYPTRVGSYFFRSQFAAKDDAQLAPGSDRDPASFASERRWASSYFYYREYQHIYKFFSSEAFNRLERTHSLLLKLDISRCFESIYTHSIAWAVRGKEFSKQTKDSKTFESVFDECMRNANWGETSGILIGPEVSRIFAEIILQAVDMEVTRSLRSLRDRIVIRRYVDDYFLFGNNESELYQAKSVIEACASRFNLHLNDKKTELVRRPLISIMAVARNRVATALGEFLKRARARLIGEGTEHFSRKAADRLLDEIRRIARSHTTEYALLASPALAIIATAVNRWQERFTQQTFDKPSDGDRIVLSILNVASHLYLMDIRASTSHKLAKLLSDVSILFDKVSGARASFEEAVIDVVRRSLERARQQGIFGPEIINLLVAADALCRKKIPVSKPLLEQALGVSGPWHMAAPRLNYFDLVATLYFARSRKSMSAPREAAVAEIERRLKTLGRKLHQRAEESMMLLDIISCPYIPEARRVGLYADISAAYGQNVSAPKLVQHVRLIARSMSFVAWRGAEHFQAMLLRKELQPAYDS